MLGFELERILHVEKKKKDYSCKDVGMYFL